MVAILRQVFVYEEERRDTSQRLEAMEEEQQEEQAEAARALLGQLEGFLDQLHGKLRVKQEQHETLVAACAASA